jgi:D-glycero-alpha-D-manno-heptose-7-phosphate kinase
MIVSRAPVRLSMGGGGTDLPSYYKKFGGFLMAAAIDKYVHVTVNRRFNVSIRLSYSETEIVERVDDIRHRIFREALRSTGIDSQIELVSVADVPANCGLGTSSTFTVALLNGLFAYQTRYFHPAELAEAACRLEIDVLQQPIGKQDQYAAAYGGFNCYWFNQDGSVTVEKVNIGEERLRDLQNNMLLFHIGQERSASDILAKQDTKTKEGDSATLQRLHKIKDIGLHTRKIFEHGDIDEFGEVLHEHWMTKKGLSSAIANSFMDEVYDTARKHGAVGGKIVGAGGGGFFLFYCPTRKTRLVSAMEAMGLNPTWFRIDMGGAKIVYQH